MEKITKQINTIGQYIAENPVQQNTDGNFVRIKKIKRCSAEPVYNMEVEKHHNFSVNGGLIVHNCIDAVRYAMYPVWKYKGY